MAEKMKNGNLRAHGANELRGTLSRAVRLLEYLRKNTDNGKPITQTDLFSAGGEDHLFGAKSTLINTVAALADALNTDEYGIPKPEEDRRLVYKGFSEHCNDKSDDEKIVGVTDIYYNHIFSEAELTAIINALCSSKAVLRTQAETIIDKLIDNLATTEYKERMKNAYMLDFSEPTDSLPGKDPALLSENIAVIQKAISGGLRVSYDYNRIYSNPKGEIKPYGERVLYVSPHYIICEKGRLFLYGGFENGELCVHRVDLITNICLAGKGKSTRPSLDKLSIGLPSGSEKSEEFEKFKVRHLYSSYEKDWITAEFEWSCRDKKTKEFICTALYGAFGNSFKIDGSGKVTVQASQFGLKIFALQYADYVKVISPDPLVKDITESVSGLRDKYL